MRTANIALSLGIGLYFSVSVNTLFWSDFYYTVLVGFTAICLFQDTKRLIDKWFGGFIISIIWAIYQAKPFINTEIYPYIRFSIGILFVLLGLIYTIICIIVKLKQYRTKTIA